MKTIFLFFLSTTVAIGATDAEIQALTLFSAKLESPERQRIWQLMAEGAIGNSISSEERTPVQRFSTEFWLELPIKSNLSGTIVDRLDVNSQHHFKKDSAINTLKEAYINWRPEQDLLVDAGRINQFSGVALGYNPTDFYRSGSIRYQVSADPNSIKNNRQGSVILRGQRLWDTGSLTMLYAPKLGRKKTQADFNFDWGATNSQSSSLFIISQKIENNLEPQGLLFLSQGNHPQLGFNLTHLVNNSSVAVIEWSGGKSQSLLEQSLDYPNKSTFHQRIATGFTYTTPYKLSLTAEYHYNGNGLSKKEWKGLPNNSLHNYIKYAQHAEYIQDIPTRHALFLYAKWQDIGIPNFDVSSMMRYNIDDYSQLRWLELRYRMQSDEIALQWQENRGSKFSNYGAIPLDESFQLLMRHYF